MKGLFKSKKRSIFALGADRRGVFAILFAAMLPALIITVGAAIDYSAAISQKMKMQSALDAAVLAGSVAARNALNQGYDNTYANAAGQSAATFSTIRIRTPAARSPRHFQHPASQSLAADR